MQLMPTAELHILPSTYVHESEQHLETNHFSDIQPLIEEIEEIFQVPFTLEETDTKPEPEVVHQQLEVEKISFYDRIIHKTRKLKEASREDWRESSDKSSVITAWLGYSAVKTAGRLQLPNIALSYASMEVLSETNSAPLTALTAAAICMGWSRVATGAMNRTINHNPRAYLSAGEHLAISQHWADALPGLRSYVSTGHRNKGIGASAMIHTKRGFVATSRLTPYISAAGREGHTHKERIKLARALSIDAGIIKGAMFAGIAVTITTVAENNPHLAENIQNQVKNPLLWGALGSITMIGEFTKNKLAKRKSTKNIESS